MITLLERLRTLTEMIIPGEAVADIGADHAHLSLFLLEHKLTNRVVIGELGDGPYQRASQAVAEHPLGKSIDVRQGDGLQVLASGEVSTVVIAGMGGDNITEILSYDRVKSESFKRYVLQPMTKCSGLRHLLANWGWEILEERIVFEQRHKYVLISCQPGNKPYILSDLEMEIGPDILRANNESKRRYIQHYLQKYRSVHRGLLQAQSQKPEKVSAYAGKIKELEAILDASQS